MVYDPGRIAERTTQTAAEHQLQRLLPDSEYQVTPWTALCRFLQQDSRTLHQAGRYRQDHHRADRGLEHLKYAVDGSHRKNWRNRYVDGDRSEASGNTREFLLEGALLGIIGGMAGLFLALCSDKSFPPSVFPCRFRGWLRAIWERSDFSIISRLRCDYTRLPDHPGSKHFPASSAPVHDDRRCVAATEMKNHTPHAIRMSSGSGSVRSRRWRRLRSASRV